MPVQYREFEVGDEVYVVDNPYEYCPFDWVDTMDKYCGEKTRIINKKYSADRETYFYHIDADKGAHAWCGNCLLKVEEYEPFDIDDDAINTILNVNPDD